MPAGNWLVYGAALENISDGVINLETDSFKVILCTSSYTPNQSTHSTYADVSAAEVANGNGYTTGGVAVTPTTTRSGLVVTFDTTDPTPWSSSTITAKYAVMVRDADANGTLVAGDLLLCYCDLETGGGSLSTTNGTFTVTMNASGVFTMTAS